MIREFHRTACHRYEDGSEGVINVSVVSDPTRSAENDFFVIADKHDQESVVVSGPEQARVLIEAIRSAVDELWGVKI